MNREIAQMAEQAAAAQARERAACGATWPSSAQQRAHPAGRGRARARAAGAGRGPLPACRTRTIDARTRREADRSRPTRPTRRPGVATTRRRRPAPTTTADHDPDTPTDHRHADRRRDDRRPPADGGLAARVSRAAGRAPDRAPVRPLPAPARRRALRAAWLGTVKAGDLERARGHPAGRGPDRARPPRHDHRPPRHRAGRLRGRGDRLRQPVPDQGPGRRGRPARAAARPRRGRAAREARRPRRAASSTSRARSTRPRGEKVEELEIEGIGTVVEPRAPTRRARSPSQLLGAVGTDNYGLAGLEQALRGRAARRRRPAPASSRTRSASRSASSRPSAPRPGEDLQLTIDARDPGARRGGAGRGRPRPSARRAPPRS